MTPERLKNIRGAFHRRFAGEPAFVARGPGRVNLIGEHTDYNDGFVLPCALPFDVLVAARPRPDEMVVLHSLNFRGDASFPLDSIEATGPRWAQYVKGVAWAMQQAGYPLRGLDIAVEGDVPVGSGLSSSAAIEVAIATAFAHATETDIPGPEIAQICKKAENDFAGVPSGIMDQFISAVGKEGHALFLDCRDLSFEQIPFDPEAAGLTLVVADTAKRRSLAESVYGQRVEECAEAVKLLRQFMPDINSLRDVPFDRFQVYQPKLPDVIRRRARHVITENARVLGAVDALRFGAIEGLGAMMNASHDSLRDDYEVTGTHLDAMVEESRRIPGVIGSRMTGAGFGGCTVTLVKTESLEHFMEEVPARYKERTGLTPALYVVQPSAGAGIV
jgi:galactokinase